MTRFPSSESTMSRYRADMPFTVILFSKVWIRRARSDGFVDVAHPMPRWLSVIASTALPYGGDRRIGGPAISLRRSKPCSATAATNSPSTPAPACCRSSNKQPPTHPLTWCRAATASRNPSISTPLQPSRIPGSPHPSAGGTGEPLGDHSEGLFMPCFAWSGLLHPQDSNLPSTRASAASTTRPWTRSWTSSTRCANATAASASSAMSPTCGGGSTRSWRSWRGERDRRCGTGASAEVSGPAGAGAAVRSTPRWWSPSPACRSSPRSLPDGTWSGR